ncbi:MAG: hypothetical protein AB1898_11070 [Acidobacteriota bacterium]
MPFILDILGPLMRSIILMPGIGAEPEGIELVPSISFMSSFMPPISPIMRIPGIELPAPDGVEFMPPFPLAGIPMP